MKCSNCGHECKEDMMFCGYCGQKLELEEVDVTEANVNAPTEELITTQSPPKSKKKTIVEKAKEKFLQFWNRIDLFSKVETIAISVTSLLLVVALCTGKVMPIIFSVIQLGGLITALFVYTGKIKTAKKWLSYLILVLSILFTGLNISSYSWFNTANSADLDVTRAVDVTTPYGSTSCVGQNKNIVINDFRSAGFCNIVEEKIEDLEIDEENEYRKVESVSINSITDFQGNQEFKSTAKVIIKYHSYKQIGVSISSEEAKNMDVENLVKELETAGFKEITTSEEFDLDPDAIQTEFVNHVMIDGASTFEKNEKFPPDAKIQVITHRPYEKYTLKVIVDFVPNLIFSTYDVEFNVSNHTEKMEHGDDAEFEYRLKKGEYTLTFTSAESSSVKGTVDINLTGDTEASLKISCYEDKVKVETIYLENQGAVGENQAMVPISAANCKYDDYKEIEQAFKKAGFNNIKTKILYDIVWGWTAEGEVEEISVNGRTDFNRGDVFAKDTDIIITYHMKEEDDPNKPTETAPSASQPEASGMVFYSTKDYETAKKGNTGGFSYKSKGGSYDIYWIIDFDEGYVYWFTDGNGETHCDRLKIESGTLNDAITITFHDGGDTWSYRLHFKYVDHPETLIMVDQNGFDYEYSPTDLDTALALKATRAVVDY